MARVLILGGGCRGRQLSLDIVGRGHAVRIITRSDSNRRPIEAVGAECFIGDPNRLVTLRGALEGVTVACWLLSTARGSQAQLRELHLSRLPAFLGAAIDSPMRGFIYEAPAEAAKIEEGIARREAIREGIACCRAIVEGIACRNAIPVGALTADPCDLDSWLQAARATLSLYL